MELKSFKTYLSEKEQIDEFIAPLLAGAARMLPAAVGAVRTGYGAVRTGIAGSKAAGALTTAATRAGQVGTRVRSSVGSLLRSGSNNPQSVLNTAQTAAMLRGGSNAIDQEQETMPGTSDGLQSSVQLRSSAMQPPPTPQLNPRMQVDNSPYSWGGRNNSTIFNLMSGRVAGARRV